MDHLLVSTKPSTIAKACLQVSLATVQAVAVKVESQETVNEVMAFCEEVQPKFMKELTYKFKKA